MNRTKIEWCDHTWNPVVGCKHNCKYCYARRMNDRFKWIENWKEPEFFPDRLDQPDKVKKPSRIFVVSMGDLFGDWVDESWIRNVLIAPIVYSQHEYMFLTKNPKRYMEFDFPANCWLGATVEDTGIEKIARMIPLVHLNTPAKKFLSIEPLLGSFDCFDLSQFDMVIVGAMTGPGAVKPKREWIESIKHDNIFFKDNIKPYL